MKCAIVDGLKFYINFIRFYLQNVDKNSFCIIFFITPRVVSVNSLGKDFFGKSVFGHFFCPILKTQNTLCEMKS